MLGGGGERHLSKLTFRTKKFEQTDPPLLGWHKKNKENFKLKKLKIKEN